MGMLKSRLGGAKELKRFGLPPGDGSTLDEVWFQSFTVVLESI